MPITPAISREWALRGVIAALRAQIDKSGEPIGGREAIWYGPHECTYCGERIIKRDTHQGPEFALAAPDELRYPNTPWLIHECRGREPRA